jgi:hypothetical protein
MQALAPEQVLVAARELLAQPLAGVFARGAG